MTATAKKRSKAAQRAAQLARAEFRAVVFNLPNQLTWARLILAAVMFGLDESPFAIPAFVVEIRSWLGGSLRVSARMMIRSMVRPSFWRVGSDGPREYRARAAARHEGPLLRRRAEPDPARETRAGPR